MLQKMLALTKMVCFLIVLLVLTACQPTEVSKPPAILPTGSPLPATPASTPLTAPTQAPTAVASTPGVWELEWTYGPGPLKFGNATAGLSKLSSYKSTLNIAFRGTSAGQPLEWSTSYVMLAAQKRAGRQLTITNTGEGLDPTNVYKAEVSGVAYERLGTKACSAVVLDQKKSLAAR